MKIGAALLIRGRDLRFGALRQRQPAGVCYDAVVSSTTEIFYTTERGNLSDLSARHSYARSSWRARQIIRMATRVLPVRGCEPCPS